MKINSITTFVPKRNSFKSTCADTLIDYQQTSYDSKKAEKMVKAGLIGMGILGMAFTLNALNKSNCNIVKNIKDGTKKIIKNYTEKSQEDPFIKELNGKRDAEALAKYKSIVAKKKMDSFHKKLLDGYFDCKPANVFYELRRNERKLRREVALGL